jgi:cell wall-associated NlpC family hydrolase
MRHATALLAVAAILCGIAAANRDDCEYDAAATTCAPLLAHDGAACAYWRCMLPLCPTTWLMETARDSCRGADDVQMAAAAELKPEAGRVDGTDVAHADGALNALQAPPAAAARMQVLAPTVASPCWPTKFLKWTTAHIQHRLFLTAMDVYRARASEHYSEAMGPRWVGIRDKLCAPTVPATSDCSSMVTWVYWTLFGNGTDIMNGEGWAAGYTGTLDKHGRPVTASVAGLQIGDLCFYYHPMHHVAIYVGGGKVVTHGMDPVGYYSWDYAPVDFCRRYIS